MKIALADKTNEVVIAVPVFKEKLNANETSSLLQLFSILGNYTIVFFTYEGLDISEYKQLLPNLSFSTTCFSRSYFKDISGYNTLLCSTVFYNRFRNFKYLLIYQLDAWVFKDELLDWCRLDYDYIGAPWFEGFRYATSSSSYIGVGNGGFSLRKVRSHIKALHSFSYITTLKELYYSFRSKKISLNSLKDLLLNLTIRNNTFFVFNNYSGQEDVFWGGIVNRNFKWFRVPGMLTAAKFSFELNAEMLYALNEKKLPFGCHAWEKYEPQFWQKYIHTKK